MKIAYLIEKLKDQLTKINQGDTEVWLKTTYALLLDHFQSFAPRARNFNSLITDYQFKKIYGVTTEQSREIKNQAIEYINETIQYLNNLQEQQSQDILQKAKILTELNQTPAPIVTHHSPHIPTPQSAEIKTRLPFDIAPSLFWGIFTAIVITSFSLGLYFGSAKFDKEKSDYYEQVKQLKTDTTRLSQTIVYKDNLIRARNSHILKLQDSVTFLNKNLQSLYLYIGNLKK